jgi:signal transduction histidine kinase
VSQTDSAWPKYLSLAVHEFRTPVTVVGGYLRMLLRDRAGAVAPNQRKLLEEIEKSCGRISTLLDEMSELGQLLDGRQPLTTNATDIAMLLRELAESVPTGDDQPRVVVDPGGEPLPVCGDRARLRRVIQSMVFALRREIIDGSELVVSARTRCLDTGRATWIAFGTPPVAAALREPAAESLEPFDVWRGGCGLALPLARQVVELHGGRLLALTPRAAQAAGGGPEPVANDVAQGGTAKQAGGVIELPLAQ